MDLIPINQDGAVALDGAPGHAVLPDVIAATVALYARKGFQSPWIGYVAIEDGRVVGSCGFAAPPGDDEAEIAYFTFPGHEGAGVASRMAQALMGRTQERADAACIRFIAHTLPVDGPSTTILRKLGFSLLGTIQHAEDGVVWKWCRLPDGQGT